MYQVFDGKCALVQATAKMCGSPEKAKKCAMILKSALEGGWDVDKTQTAKLALAKGEKVRGPDGAMLKL